MEDRVRRIRAAPKENSAPKGSTSWGDGRRRQKSLSTWPDGASLVPYGASHADSAELGHARPQRDPRQDRRGDLIWQAVCGRPGVDEGDWERCAFVRRGVVATADSARARCARTLKGWLSSLAQTCFSPDYSHPASMTEPVPDRFCEYGSRQVSRPVAEADCPVAVIVWTVARRTRRRIRPCRPCLPRRRRGRLFPLGE